MNRDLRQRDCRSCLCDNESHDPLVGCLICPCPVRDPRSFRGHQALRDAYPLNGTAYPAQSAARMLNSGPRAGRVYGRPKQAQRRFCPSAGAVLRYLAGVALAGVLAALMMAGVLFVGLVLLALVES